MTRAQQTQVIRRLRELQAMLATVDYSPAAKDTDRSPGYLVGYCAGLVGVALREAGETTTTTDDDQKTPSR